MTPEQSKQEDLYRFVSYAPEDFRIEFWNYFGRSAVNREYKDFKSFVGTELDSALYFVKGAMIMSRIAREALK